MVVTACLIVLKHHLGDLIEVSSDGKKSDWKEGLDLAKRIIKKKTCIIADNAADITDNNRNKKQIIKNAKINLLLTNLKIKN